MEHLKRITPSYDFDPHIAEVYDATETYTNDIDLLRCLIGPSEPLRIREPFCGTGRILIPLAQAGHTIYGSDISGVMIERACAKVKRLPVEVQDRITIRQGDALVTPWGCSFDLAILGANCLYEFSSAADQEACILRASGCLKDGGYIYVDNNARQGSVSASEIGHYSTWPTGVCSDGYRLEGHSEIVDIDLERNLWIKRRRLQVTDPSGRPRYREWETVTHPVSMEEVHRWLIDNGFQILHLFGNRLGDPFTKESDRAIFWAQKTS